MKKFISLLLCIVAILNLLLLALREVSPLLFWVNIGVIAGLAYWVVPQLK